MFIWEFWPMLNFQHRLSCQNELSRCWASTRPPSYSTRVQLKPGWHFSCKGPLSNLSHITSDYYLSMVSFCFMTYLYVAKHHLTNKFPYISIDHKTENPTQFLENPNGNLLLEWMWLDDIRAINKNVEILRTIRHVLHCYKGVLYTRKLLFVNLSKQIALHYYACWYFIH